MTVRVKHTFSLNGRCPVDGALDYYTITVETNRVLEVHAMVGTARRLLSEPIFQEDFTARFAKEIGAKVTTAGRHGEVFTEVTA